MVNNCSAEYSQRSDGELLVLASDRASLTTEAALALEAELRRRNLTNSDLAKHQQFVKQYQRREAKRLRRRILGTARDRSSWVDLFWAVVVMTLISCTYLALPTKYHFKPDWQEAAVDMMFASVFIAVSGGVWWRKIAFWMSLITSSAVHVFAVHAWRHRVGSLRRGEGKVAVLLGFLLFFAFYGFVRLLQRNIYSEDVDGLKRGRALE